MGGAGARRGAGIARLVGALALSWVACAGDPLIRTENGQVAFQHRKLGYRIDAPRFPASQVWERVTIEEVDLGYRETGGANMSLLSECERPPAHPAVRARNLLIGISPRKLLSSSPLAVAGHPGWTQTVETLERGVPVIVKSVTIVRDSCTFDWLLVAPREFDRVERTFDEWWTSFRLPPVDADAGAEEQ